MIKVTNLTKVYKSKYKFNTRALNNINFSLDEKGLVFIIGKSGSGKSTLLNLLGGLDDVTSGSVEVFNNSIHEFKEKQLYDYRSSMIGFIFQDFHLLEDLTVEENILLSLELKKENTKELVNEVLKQVDLEGYNKRYPNELSGGEKQRIAIARALIKNPNIILADEPTGNLDSKTTKQVIELIKKISKDKLVVIVSHNLNDAYEYADRIIELSNGEILNDLERNKDYSNDIRIEENAIILPMLKRFTNDELELILNESKKDNIKRIVQDETKFIKYNEKQYEERKIDINKSNLSMKSTFKFSYLFGKKRLVNFILSSFMAAAMVVVLALAQSIAYFDQTKLIAKELKENDTVLSVRKNLDSTQSSSAINIITDAEYKSVVGDEDVDAYKLYTFNINYTNGIALTTHNFPSSRLNSIFLEETNGTLVTTKEYAKKVLKLDNLEIYTGNIEYNPAGVYVTDYIADCIIAYGNAKTYNDVLGEYFESGKFGWGYINGIIKTNYLKTYEDELLKIKEIDELSDLDEDGLNFVDFLNNSLAICYSFEENFAYFQKEDCITRDFQYCLNLTIDSENVYKKLSYVTSSSGCGKVLNDDEVFINYSVYNNIFDTYYTSSNVHTFEPHTIEFETYDNYKKIYYKKTLKVVGIGGTTEGRMVVADNVFKELRDVYTVAYGIYIDGENLDNVINNIINNDFTSNSIRMNAVQTMSKAVSVFNKFFELIVFILLFACVFIITSFGIKNVKTNIYEIGVLKALGCKYNRFLVLFMLHTMTIILFIIFFSVFGFYMFSDLANKILVASLSELAASRIMIELEFIAFDLQLISFDCILIVIISLLSTLVPLTLLKRIKPISIIKAKE